MKYFILFPVIFLISCRFLNAQQDCRNALEEANDLYEQGLFTEIPNILSSCLQDGFSRTERIEAYKLIILSYLFDDDTYGAERTMDEFLKKYPEYEPMHNDPVEFVYLFESYKTSAIFSINFHLGPTITYPLIIRSHTALDRSNLTQTNKVGAGFFAGIGLGYELTPEMTLHLEAYYSTHNYEVVENGSTKAIQESVNRNSTELGSIQVSFKENIQKIDIPLTLTYKFGTGAVSYFARGGFGFGLVSSATGIPTRSGSDGSVLTETDLDIKDLRSQLFYSAILGGGVRFKVPRGFISIDGRITYGINNMTNTDGSNERLTTRYYYQSDEFRLVYFSLGVGYNFSLYRSKKN